MTFQDILKQDIDKVIALYNSGTSMNKLGDMYGCNSGTIYHFLKNHNVITRPKQFFAGNVEDYSDIINKMYSDGKSIQIISKQLGISTDTIWRFLQKHFDTSINRTWNPDNLLRDKKQQVIDLHLSGMSAGDISRKIGHSQSQVSTLLNKLGYDLSNWTIKVDETFFEEINTQNKAYVLGWMFSDGNVMDNGLVRLSIHYNDIEILQKIKDVMKYKGELHRNRNMICLNISRKKIAKDLINLGCIPRKSLVLKFPTIQPHLLSHFMRGCYDGDGSILLRKNGRFNTNITSSDDFISGWKQELDRMDIYYSIYKKKPEKTTSSLFTNRIHDSIKLVKFLYQDANLFLQRKYDKCKAYL